MRKSFEPLLSWLTLVAALVSALLLAFSGGDESLALLPSVVRDVFGAGSAGP